RPDSGVVLNSSSMPVTILLRGSFSPATSRNRSSCCILSDTLLFIYITIIFSHNILERHSYKICGSFCRPGCHFVDHPRFRLREYAEHITGNGSTWLPPVNTDADALLFIRRQMQLQLILDVLDAAGAVEHQHQAYEEETELIVEHEDRLDVDFKLTQQRTDTFRGEIHECLWLHQQVLFAG